MKVYIVLRPKGRIKSIGLHTMQYDKIRILHKMSNKMSNKMSDKKAVDDRSIKAR